MPSPAGAYIGNVLRFLLVVIVLAVAVYLVTRMVQQRGLSPRTPVRRRPTRPPRVLGPDDDDEFLRDLDRKRRHPEDPDASP